MERPEDKTILVVDDEPDVQNYLKMILTDAGFQVVCASDGQAALEIIRKDKPDFISLDLVMPRKSGHKLLYELRRDEELSRIPVLIVTAHAKDELGKKDLDDILENKMISGPGTYLEKPVNPNSYVRAIQRALGLEESPRVEDKKDLKDELTESIKEADPDALKRALEALRKSQQN
jgi:CheY-like chemotaxis protein